MSKKKNSYDFLAKILMIGDSGVGKSCLMLRFCENKFTTLYVATIGVDFMAKTIDMDGKKINMQVWDTSGQEKYKSIAESYYKGSIGIILTYSVTDRESFMNIENWMKRIKQHASGDVCKILIGNKCDMPNRMVSYEEGKSLADYYGVQFFETSAKDSLNVDDAFNCLAREVKKKLYNKVDVEPTAGGTGGSIRLSVMPETETQTQKSGCC